MTAPAAGARSHGRVWVIPNRNTVGLFALAVAMWYAGASQTNGAAFGTLELATNKNNFEYLAFDPTTQEFVDYLWFPPASWDGGTPE
jgi:hypothetical protein